MTRFCLFQYPAALMNLGAILHLNGKLQDAEANYLRALQLKPDDTITQSNLRKLWNIMEKQSLRTASPWVGSPSPPTRHLHARHEEKTANALCIPFTHPREIEETMGGYLQRHQDCAARALLITAELCKHLWPAAFHSITVSQALCGIWTLKTFFKCIVPSFFTFRTREPEGYSYSSSMRQNLKRSKRILCSIKSSFCQNLKGHHRDHHHLKF